MNTNPPSGLKKLWHDYVAVADAHRQIGWTSITLETERDPENLPWVFVTDLFWGPMDGFVGDIAIVATHPSGLTFTWWVRPVVYEFRQRLSVGYYIDETQLALLNNLPISIRPKLKSLIERSIQVIEAKNSELSNTVRRGVVAINRLNAYAAMDKWPVTAVEQDLEYRDFS